MWAACIKIRPTGYRRSGAGATWPALPRACYAVSLTLIVPSTPSWTVQGSATVIAVGVGRPGVGRDHNLRRRLVCASQGQPKPGIPLVVTSHRLCHLTFTPPAVIIVVANVSFGLASPAAAPKELFVATQPWGYLER